MSKSSFGSVIPLALAGGAAWDGSLKQLGLTVRVSNCLKNAQITSVAELVACHEFDVAVLTGIGKKGLQNIRECLTLQGLTLSDKRNPRFAFFPDFGGRGYLRRDPALREEQIVRILRVNVRNAPLVAKNLYWLPHSRDALRGCDT